MEMMQNNAHIKINPAKRLILHSAAAAAAKHQQIALIIMNKRQKDYEARLLNKLKEKSRIILIC
jgi:hypothetical protein